MMAHTPTIALAVVSFAFGGLAMSRNFTLQKGNFKFSTDDDTHSIERLDKQYKSRVAQLKGAHSSDLLRKYESDSTNAAEKRAVVETVVGFYLGHVSRDSLFGHDIVIFSGTGKPTIMRRADFDEVSDAWKRVLILAGIKDCVETVRVEHELSACHRPAPVVKDSLHQCMEKRAPNDVIRL